MQKGTHTRTHAPAGGKPNNKRADGRTEASYSLLRGQMISAAQSAGGSDRTSLTGRRFISAREARRLSARLSSGGRTPTTYPLKLKRWTKLGRRHEQRREKENQDVRLVCPAASSHRERHCPGRAAARAQVWPPPARTTVHHCVRVRGESAWKYARSCLCEKGAGDKVSE